MWDVSTTSGGHVLYIPGQFGSVAVS